MDALADAGFAAWTPTETRVRRVGRARTRQEFEAPILSQFVFAPFAQLKDLLAMSHSPALTYRTWDRERQCFIVRGYPYFTVFRNQGEVPRVADRTLEPLRSIEEKLRVVFAKDKERERQRGEVPRFAEGDIVRVDDGAFGGLDLVVIEPNEGKLVSLTCEGWAHPLEISAWKLRGVQLRQAEPEQAGCQEQHGDRAG